jgi:hypothetical protein
MLKVSRISSPLIATHRAWSRCSSTKPTKPDVETQVPLPQVLLSPQPIKPRPTKPGLTQKFEWKDDTRSLAFKFKYLGFLWDPLNGIVSLTEEARTRCLQIVETGLASVGQPAKDQSQLREVIACLQHASHVVASGRSRLESLVEGELCKGQGDEYLLSGFLKGRMKRDLEWWLTLLEKKGDTTEIINLRQGKVANKIYTDASSWGLAVVIDDKWNNWRWKDGFSPDTEWAEATAVEIAVKHLVTQPGAEGSHFTINCDNTLVVDRWTTGHGISGKPQVDKVMLSILHSTVQHGCWLSLKWIPSNENLADGPSRSKTGPKPLRSRLKWNSSVIPEETLKHLHTSTNETGIPHTSIYETGIFFSCT